MEKNAYGMWVACISLSQDERPYVLLTDHIQCDADIPSARP